MVVQLSDLMGLLPRGATMTATEAGISMNAYGEVAMCDKAAYRPAEPSRPKEAKELFDEYAAKNKKAYDEYVAYVDDFKKRVDSNLEQP